MSLITKKLQQLQSGTVVEITMNDDEKTKFLGTVVENDFEESIEIVNDSGELLVTYEDIRNVKIVNTSADTVDHGKTSPPPIVPGPSVQDETTKDEQEKDKPAEDVGPKETEEIKVKHDKNINTLRSKLSFIETVIYTHLSDAELDAIFKTEIPKEEKKIINNYYQSYKAKIKANETEACAGIVERLTDEMKNSFTSFCPATWRFLVHLLVRANGKINLGVFEKNRMFDFLAVYYYKEGKPEKASVFAALAILYCQTERNRKALYTVLAEACFTSNNFGVIALMLNDAPTLLSDAYFTELTEYVYQMNGMEYPILRRAAHIISDMSMLYDTTAAEKRFYVNQRKQEQAEEEARAVEEANAPEPEAEASGSAGAPETEPEHGGEIVYLSWSSEKGKIESANTIFEFTYADINNNALLKKVKTLMVSDLKAKNCTIPVRFTEKDGKITILREDRNFKKGASCVIEAPAIAEKENYIQAGRALLAVAENENRFLEALPYFEKALGDPAKAGIALTEYINCCMTIANKADDGSYLEKAYDCLTENIGSIPPTTGIVCNECFYKLCNKMKKREEALHYLNQILADPKLPVETRLNYILTKAALLFEMAQHSTEEGEAVKEAYERSKMTYMDWEQRYSERVDIKSSPRFKKIYYNIVLLGIARCHISTGDTALGQEMLKRIIQFDPTNEIAKNLFTELSSENRHESSDTDDAEAENETDIFEPADTEDFSDEPEDNGSMIYEYKDASGWSKLDLQESDVINFVFGSKQKLPVALTYLKAASGLNPKFSALYDQFSYATNNPIEKLNYALANVVTKFDAETSLAPVFEKYAKAAAIIRGSFYHTAESDYFTGAAYIDDVISEAAPSFTKAAEITDTFRSLTGKGMDAYADYRVNPENHEANGIERAVRDASILHEQYFTHLFHENVSQKRFKLTKAIVFERSGLLEQLLLCIINNDRTAGAELKKAVAEKFIRTGAVVSSNNIDPLMIEEFIDEAWSAAGKDKSIHERVSSVLMGSLRNNIKIPTKRILEVFCSWINAIPSDESYEEAENLKTFRANKDLLVGTLSSAVTECTDALTVAEGQEAMGLEVLLETAGEILKMITGTWNEDTRKFYFADFLKNGCILLDDDYMPELSSTFCDLPEFNVLARIRAHAEDDGADIIGYAERIFTREEKYHNFGIADKITEYLKSLGRENDWQMPENSEELEKLAQKKMRSCYEDFNIELCAASSRGQINNSDAFIMSIDDTVQYWYQFCLESKNYGFFASLIASCEKVIHDKALEYGEMLSKQLKKVALEYLLDTETVSKISSYIDNQMFTVAEELMSRISKGDVDSDIDLPDNINEVLEQFWNEFEKNFNLMSSGSGTTLSRLVSTNMASKDKKGGEALINNWPRKKNYTSVEQIKNLTERLGWNDVTVEATTALGSENEAFKVIQSRRIFNNREYAHPIAAFGTQSCENGFYIFCYFGYADSGRLIDLCRKLDSVAGNKIILIDYTLSASDRRKLAKLMKQSSFVNTYLFVDRISVFFLANHYVGGGGDVNNRTLLAISMPFSYYQPYSLGSTVPTPPELFSGRREELLSVESPQGANLIYGGRQLGKTAILRKAANEILDPETGRYAYVIDIKEKNSQQAALAVSRYFNTEGLFDDDQITDDWDTFAFHLRKNIRDKDINYLLLMLDEADCFIDDCKNYNYSPFVALKDIQQSMNGIFKFVLAGLHDVVKFKRDVSLGNNSVIPHLSYINVKPFDFQTAKKLLKEPLCYLGFDFGSDEESEALFMQIFSATNYYPGLIQMFCNKLIDNMRTGYAGYNEANTPGYKVTSQQVSKVLADKEFLAEIKRKFEITLRLGEKNYYYIIALLLAMLFLENESAEGYTMDDIATMATELGSDIFDVIPRDTLDASLEELCDLNILKTIGSGYTFRTKSFRDLLGSKDEVFEELVKLIDAL